MGGAKKHSPSVVSSIEATSQVLSTAMIGQIFNLDTPVETPAPLPEK